MSDSALANDFIEAPHSGGSYQKLFLVAHSTEGPEVGGAARDVIAYWNRTRKGSTQYVVDDHEIIQAVPENAYAWAAGSTANKYGIHVEHVGYAAQDAAEWNDAYSRAELDLSAPLFADLARRHGIPVRRIGPDQLRACVRAGDPALGGICGHADVTAAWGETTHTDPGPRFPWASFIETIRDLEDDMALSDSDIDKIVDRLMDRMVNGLTGPWGKARRLEDVLRTTHNMVVPGKWRDQLRSWIRRS